MGYQGKVLGVDYGDVRTGLAVSDPTGMLAFGIMTIKENGMRNTAKRVAAGPRRAMRSRSSSGSRRT